MGISLFLSLAAFYSDGLATMEKMQSTAELPALRLLRYTGTHCFESPCAVYRMRDDMISWSILHA